MSENSPSYEHAIKILARKFDDEIADPRQTAKDVVEWYNAAEPDDDDIELMSDLVLDGKFEAWDCPTCGDRVFNGQPDSFDDFQGCRNQDLTGYPGNSSNSDRQCDYCRCHNVKMDAAALAHDEWADIDDILDDHSERSRKRR